MGTGTGEYPSVCVAEWFVPEPVPIFSQPLRFEEVAAAAGAAAREPGRVAAIMARVVQAT